jgi:hypothetical protein
MFTMHTFHSVHNLSSLSILFLTDGNSDAIIRMLVPKISSCLGSRMLNVERFTFAISLDAVISG